MTGVRSRWTGGLAAVLMIVLFAFAPAASAADPAPAAASAAAPASAPVAASPATVEQMRAMVSTLEDPDARAKLVEQLKALIAAQQGLTPAAAANAAEPPPLPETIGANALAFLAERMAVVSRQIVEVADVFHDLPGTVDWLRRQIQDPDARQRWGQVALQLLLMLVAGLGLQRLTARLLDRPRRALAAKPGAAPLVRVPLLLGRALLELVPVLALLVVSYAVLSVSDPVARVRLAALEAINAIVLIQLLLIGVRAVVAPDAPNLRPLHLGDAAAGRLYGWVRRLIAVGVSGYFLAEGAFVLGLPLGAYGALLKLLGLVLAVLLIVLILRNRRAVADWMRGHALTGNGVAGETEAREASGQGAVLRSARRRFADVWHVLAIAYVVVAFGVWALNVYGGFAYLARATVATLVIAAVARYLVTITNRALHRGLRAGVARGGSLPQLRHRVHHYGPLLHRAAKTAIWLVALVLIADGWGVDSLAWTGSTIGRRVVGSVVTITLLLVAAMVAWEIVSALIEHLLSATDRGGARIERSGRVRTLLPLLRNAFLVLLITMVSLITLSELGVNIAPLLAGAGVVGLAIGFGSQTLVKDIITGLFILLEDSISVGDVVDVGDGHSGVVEAISIRSIRLRDLTGAVHTVPFSAVTTVKNMTKDYSCAVFDVGVAYGEDTDRVIGVLSDLGAEMREDPLFAPDILEPLEVMGLDRFADSAIIIRARFKTRAMKQWSIAREFNRRLKKRFDDLGIEIPFPHMKLITPGGARPPETAPVPTATASPMAEG